MRNFVCRHILLLLLVLPAIGCATVPSSGLPAVLPETATIFIRHQSTSRHGGVLVEFDMRSLDFSHIVQEITLDSGHVLVECFRNDGTLYDRHTWASTPHSRSMVVYGADCEGVDEWGGFGHLPDNGFGLKTTVGPNFNKHYQSIKRTQGRITARASNSYYWSISDDGTNITVIINGETVE